MLYLDDPRAPTTATPLGKALKNLKLKWARLSPRMPDRGARVPVNGVPQKLPSGGWGGVPRFPKALLQGLEEQPLPKVSTSQAQTLQSVMKITINAERLKLKRRVRIVPGDYGLRHAKAGPRRVSYTGGLGVGKILYRAGLIDTVTPESRGQFAQNRVVPRSLQARGIFRRLGKDLGGVDVPRGQGGVGLIVEPDTLQYREAGQAITAGRPLKLGSAGDWGSPFVRPPPENQLTTGVGNQGGGERMLFLVGAVFVAWLIFRGKGA